MHRLYISATRFTNFNFRKKFDEYGHYFSFTDTKIYCPRKVHLASVGVGEPFGRVKWERSNEVSATAASLFRKLRKYIISRHSCNNWWSYLQLLNRMHGALHGTGNWIKISQKTTVGERLSSLQCYTLLHTSLITYYCQP